MKPLTTLFAGTPEFSVPALKALIDSPHRPVAVLTQPDRGAGRGRRIQFSPVKQCALDAGIEVLQPSGLKTADIQAQLADFQPDLIITAAYGLLVPPAILELPRHGCWNLHASLLPRWRGASPINQSILAGDAESGVSLMQMDAGLDTGPVLLAEAVDIRPDDTAGSLHDRLSLVARQVLMSGLERLLQGSLPEPIPQNDALATHAPLIRKDDARLDWQQAATTLARQVRGYNPWPVAYGEIEGLSCRVFAAQAIDTPAPARELAPGELLRGQGERDVIVIRCGEGCLAIESLQAPGRKRLSARDWLNAHPDWR
ncbi:MAG: methionyl-tRNA formyltransferase [Wenzhouxiangella sp.]